MNYNAGTWHADAAKCGTRTNGRSDKTNLKSFSIILQIFVMFDIYCQHCGNGASPRIPITRYY